MKRRREPDSEHGQGRIEDFLEIGAAGPDDRTATAAGPGRLNPWLIGPALALLLVVVAIWWRTADQLAANHWAYPVLLVGTAAVCLMVVVRPVLRRPGGRRRR